jgi:hypothetical protein
MSINLRLIGNASEIPATEAIDRDKLTVLRCSVVRKSRARYQRSYMAARRTVVKRRLDSSADIAGAEKI